MLMTLSCKKPHVSESETTFSVSSAMKRNDDDDDDDLLVLKKITFFHLLSLPTVPWFFFFTYIETTACTTRATEG